MKYCTIDNIPTEVKIDITNNTRVERVVEKIQTYKRLGVQVIHISGILKRLADCKEILKLASNDISFFVDRPEVLPEEVKEYVENAYC